MFDQEVPQTLTPIQQLQMSSKRLGNVFAPAVEKATGYISPEREMRRVASETDLSDSDAVQKTFNFLMSKNPQAAASWLKSVKPTIDYHIAQQKKPTMTDFDKKIALWKQNPELFKQMKEAGVIGGGGVNVTVGGKDTAFDFADKVRISKDWRAETKDERTNLTAIDFLYGLIQQAKDGNPAAYEGMKPQFSKLLGDSRVNEGEIKRLSRLGSYGQRIIDGLSIFAKGIPTEQNLNYFEDVVEYLEERNWNSLNTKKNKEIASYSAIFPESKQGEKKRLLEMINPIFDIGPNPATVGARKQKTVVRQLCTQLKQASESGDTETADKISAALKNAGITSCKG